MMAEVNLTPVGSSMHLSSEIAEALKLIDASGLSYQITPAGTCIEGQWDEVMDLIKRCHDKLKEKNAYLITSIRIEDKEGEENLLKHNIRSVEEKTGFPLKTGTVLYADY